MFQCDPEMNHYILISAIFWVRTSQKNRINRAAEPVMVGSYYVGRVVISGKLIGGTVLRSGSGFLFFGALERRHYFDNYGEYEVILNN